MGLVHETITCASILITYSGEVKISDTERCRRGGDPAKFADSFSRMVMQLMDKTRPHDGPVGLTLADQWSLDAIDFFRCAAGGHSVGFLLNHKFMERRQQEELMWLVPFIMISADHRRQ